MYFTVKQFNHEHELISSYIPPEKKKANYLENGNLPLCIFLQLWFSGA